MSTMKFKQAQRLLREFPFLWSILPSWTDTQTIEVSRLSVAVLVSRVRCGQHRVFQFNTEYIQQSSGLTWRQWVYEVPIERSQMLVDALSFHRGIAYPGTHRLPSAEAVTKALVILKRHEPQERDAILHGNPDDYDSAVIFKPPRWCSINALVREVCEARQNAHRRPDLYSR